MQVDTRKECSLARMGLKTRKVILVLLISDCGLLYMYPSKGDQVMVVLEIKNLLLIHCRARVRCAVLLRHQQMRNLQLVFVLDNVFCYFTRSM
jgi:hypothetical protein